MWRADSEPSGEPTLGEAKPSEDSGAAIAASIEREARERRTGMPRQARKESGTGIFHVMMRGINHQDRRTKQEQRQSLLGLCLARRRKTKSIE